MTEFKVIINDEEYTEDRFKKDVARMFDTFRDSDCSEYMGSTNCEGVDCDDCPLYSDFYSCEDSKDDSFERIKIVYKWAQEHPVFTNKDMLEKTFGKYALNHISSSLYGDLWLKQEYKEPSKEPREEEND
jgi:hypothetical protein